MFRPVENNVRFPELETEVIRFWNEREIYQKSLAGRAGAPRFVFYEGPPTANGLPHPGHCLTRAIKDLFPRYRTMRGYLCERKAGWDTHGLPVEVEVCKELGIHSKEEIESFGVEPFIHRCQESVFRYTKEWERLTERLGFWIRLDEAYVTYHQSYIESVWWSLKTLFDRGLLYQGHKIVWWWAQGGTALSSGEVGLGYREVADPSVYVRFRLVDEPDTDLLVWTTTPWTLPSNQFVAVHPNLEYAVVRHEDRKLIIASTLVDTILAKGEKGKNAPAPAMKSGLTDPLRIQETLLGRDLIGRRYVPPFDYYYATLGSRKGDLKAGGTQHVAWRIVAADFVTVESGTGLVHEAPAFGEVDFDLLASESERFVAKQGPELICAVGPDGKFTAEAPDYQGRWVKEADKDIVRDLKRRGLLFHHEQYLHEYPFCWRADEDPLIQYPRRSWFIRTKRFRDAMLANNAQINWLPDHIKEGRFGNFLESNVDWALSRERYWGTPLPIWICEKTGRMEAIGSYAELLAKPGVCGTEVWEAAKLAKPEISEHLRVHKPYIDAIHYDSPHAQGARMRRVGDVIDCWYDSGAMPFAQWGYPHQGADRFAEQFPADFISEALDQTRGWFYSQLAISTLLFGDEDSPAMPRTLSPLPSPLSSAPWPHPFKNCIVLGLMLSEWWECEKCKWRSLEETARCPKCEGPVARKIGKMSKQLRNYREPNEIFNRHGADALRWYFFANQAPWTSIIYSERAIKESIPEFLLRLWNVHTFFVIYANIDRFDPAAALAGDVGGLDPAALAKAKGRRPIGERGELDRWITSELNGTIAAVTASMDAYDNYAAGQRLNAFVDALSNWYVRRSRDRFWSGDQSPDKLDGYWTLYESLLTTARLVAPFIPFLAETIWQNLAVASFGERALESVHLTDYPQPDATAIDERLSARMGVLRDLVSLGRAARMSAKLKVRQPLSKVECILSAAEHRDWLEEHAGLIREELNVKLVEFPAQADQYVSYTVLPDLKRLGPRLGKGLPAVRAALGKADPAALLAQLAAAGHVSLDTPQGPVALDRDDIQVRLEAKPGWTAAQGPAAVVVLSTEVTGDLATEGLARELVHAIQVRRKERGLEFTDRIKVSLATQSEPIREAAARFSEYIMSETLAVELSFAPLAGQPDVELNLDGHDVTLCIEVVKST